MITLSTLPNGTKGYALYVDGAWVGASLGVAGAGSTGGRQNSEQGWSQLLSGQHALPGLSTLLTPTLNLHWTAPPLFDLWIGVHQPNLELLALAKQVGELGPGSTTVDGRSVDATGGGPADLTDSIYLCSRSDSDHQRCAGAGIGWTGVGGPECSPRGLVHRRPFKDSLFQQWCHSVRNGTYRPKPTAAISSLDWIDSAATLPKVLHPATPHQT